MFDLFSEFNYLIPFFIATFIFGFVPGPSIMYLMAQTIARDRRGGLSAALGIHIGCFVHIIAAALGLSAVFVFMPSLFMAVKFIGAAYLIYLGVKMIISQSSGEIPVDHITTTSRTTFLNSIMVEALNPKTAIFFIAFLPQFIDVTASWPVWLQFIILGQFINIAFSTADLIYIFLAGYIVNKLKGKGGKNNILQWIGGSVLIILAIYMVFEN